MMELQTTNLPLAQLEDNKWYYFETDRDFSNTFTAVKLSDNKVFVKLIGGDFDEPFVFWFEYNQESFNELWQYEFREDYHHPIDKEKDTLFGMDELATIPFSMIIDLHYTCKHMGVVENAE